MSMKSVAFSPVALSLKSRSQATVKVERMEYNDATDAEYKRMLETVKFIGSMWRYPDDPGESPEQHEMGALMLLAAAIEALSMFNVQYQMDDPVQP